MRTNRAKFDQAGRVVIPAEYRRALGMKAGEEVIVVLEEHSVRLITAEAAVNEARQLLGLPHPGRSLTDELIRERHEEAAGE